MLVETKAVTLRGTWNNPVIQKLCCHNTEKHELTKLADRN